MREHEIFQKLQAVCNHNYYRLHQCLPKNQQHNTGLSWQTTGGGRFNLYWVKVEPYTEILHFHSEISSENSQFNDFSLELRLYHDVASAEALSYQYKKPFLGQKKPSLACKPKSAYEKWQLNLLVSETLKQVRGLVPKQIVR